MDILDTGVPAPPFRVPQNPTRPAGWRSLHPGYRIQRRVTVPLRRSCWVQADRPGLMWHEGDSRRALTSAVHDKEDASVEEHPGNDLRWSPG